jgi:hypothetical protein
VTIRRRPPCFSVGQPGECGKDLLDDRVGGAGHVHGDRILRMLEGGELAREQARRHVMAAALREARAQKRLLAHEMDEMHAPPAGHQDVPIGLLERRAGEHHAALLGEPAADLGRERLEPGAPVLVVEGDAAAHLLDIGLRMIAVALDELGIERLGEQQPDRRLADPAHPHDDDDHDDGDQGRGSAVQSEWKLPGRSTRS